MTFNRLPLFTWMTLIVSFLIVFAFPSITVALILLMFDRLMGTAFFLPGAGATPCCGSTCSGSSATRRCTS